MKICIVVANYYPKISDNLISKSVEILKKNGLNEYKKIYVPGIYEIPFIISKNINTYDAFITLGCVIKGETPHFEFLCSSVFNEMINLSTKHKKPIGNGIITCLNKKQALNRSNLKGRNKGEEATKAIISLLDLE